MNFRAIIKGKPIVAKEEAEKRGLKFTFSKYGPRTDETICDLTGPHLNVQKWFCEPNPMIKCYKEGTLMFYNCVN